MFFINLLFVFQKESDRRIELYKYINYKGEHVEIIRLLELKGIIKNVLIISDATFLGMNPYREKASSERITIKLESKITCFISK